MTTKTPAVAEATLDQLTLGEIAQAEEISGLSITQMSDPVSPKGRLLIALAYLMKKRTDPTFTINQAEALSMAEVSALTSPDPKGSPA